MTVVKLQKSFDELRKSNLSVFPTSLFNRFIEKSEFPTFLVIANFAITADYFHFGNSQ